MAAESLDTLITKHAAEFAEQVRAVAAIADKEEEIRIAVEKQLAFLQKAAGITLQGKHEFTVASGRADSVYQRVIIEYKNPSSAGARIGETLDSPGSKKVVKQIQDRFRDLQTADGHPIERLFGVGCDGNRFIFVRWRDKKWDVQQPVEVNKYTTERFLWALFNLGYKGKAFRPEYLAADFGSNEGSIARAGIPVLYHAIRNAKTPKAKTFFNQWKILFGEVCGYDVDNPSDKIKKLATSYGIGTSGGGAVHPAELLFAVHTYYAVFMKLLAGGVVAKFHKLPDPVSKLHHAATPAKFKGEMEELEKGSIFRHFNITNFLEGDLFAWYLPEWSDDIYEFLRGIVTKFDDYNPQTLAEEPNVSRDLLKKLYQELFPKSVRHDLGEYYTPDWLAEHVLNEVGYDGDPDTRILDPACGSGTFLVLAINRIRQRNDALRPERGLEDHELARKILANCIGFDLNPLAVMAARTNYLIAIRGLIDRLDRIEIPVYLCDSVVTPVQYADLYQQETLKVPCAGNRPPHLFVPKEVATDPASAATYAIVLERCIIEEATAAEFLSACEVEGLPITHKDAHRALYDDLARLAGEGKNGVWARIIKNSFAPLFCDSFDLVVGNPPWVNWEHLPAGYRHDYQSIWNTYRLAGEIPIARRQRSDASKTDISILMTYVAAHRYLREGGRLGFVITRTVFQSELGGWHFRAFRLPEGIQFRVDAVHDMDLLKPFRVQAANITAVMMLTRGQQTEYPVDWFRYAPLDYATIDEDDDLPTVTSHSRRTEWSAWPIDSYASQSAWVFGERDAVKIVRDLAKPSYYAPFAREGLNTRGANGIYFLDARNANGRLMVSNKPADGRDNELRLVEQTIEPDYVFPLLRGRNVQQFRATPTSYVLVPHDADAPVNPAPFRSLPPKTREFLSAFSDELKRRRPFRNFDPSSGDYHGLYSVLEATFTQHKVVWREMASGAIAAAVSTAQLPRARRKLSCPTTSSSLFLARACRKQIS